MSELGNGQSVAEPRSRRIHVYARDPVTNEAKWAYADELNARPPLYGGATKRKEKGKPAEKCEYLSIDYREEMRLAKTGKNPLLAVRAELFRLHFEQWGKGEAFPLGLTNPLKLLGVSRHVKVEVLKKLEAAGWISVQWTTGKAPLVTILKGFYLKRHP